MGIEKKNNSYTSEKILIREITFYDLFAILWRRRKHIFFISFLFILVGIIYAFMATPWYAATVKILPKTSTTSVNLLNQYAGIATMAGLDLPVLGVNRQALYQEIIESNFVLDRVLQHRFHTKKFQKPITLFEFLKIDIDSSNQESQIRAKEKIKKKLRDEFIHSDIDQITQILTIRVTVPHDPILAADLANFIVKQLDIYNKQFRKYKASEQRAFIEKSIKETKLNLEKAEEKLKKFQEENRDMSSPETQLQYERLRTEVEVQRTVYIELRKQLEIAKIEEVKETETLNIMENAIPPIYKFKPKRMYIILFFIFIGFIIGIIYSFFSYTLKYKNGILSLKVLP